MSSNTGFIDNYTNKSSLGSSIICKQAVILKCLGTGLLEAEGAGEEVSLSSWWLALWPGQWVDSTDKQDGMNGKCRGLETESVIPGTLLEPDKRESFARLINSPLGFTFCFLNSSSFTETDCREDKQKVGGEKKLKLAGAIKSEKKKQKQESEAGRKSKHLPPLVQLQENLDGFIVLSDGQREVPTLKTLVARFFQQLGVSCGVHPVRRRGKAGSTGFRPLPICIARSLKGQVVHPGPSHQLKAHPAHTPPHQGPD